MRSRSITKTALPLLLAAVGLAGARGAQAQRELISIPADTVVRVQLNERISSREARVGDRFTVTVADNDRSGFPDGTRLEGVVSDVQRRTEERPAQLDMDFRRAVLPDGRSVTINGQLASLEEEDVRRGADGRISSRRRSGSSRLEPKWVGYGAGAGAVLATVFGGSFLKGALLGGLGGAVYGYLNRDKGRGEFREVDIPANTVFGVRLDSRVAFEDRNTFRYAGGRDRFNDRVGDRVGDRVSDRVAGDREVFRYGTPVVRLNGRDVTFGATQPLMLNGTLFVPLAPVAQAANLRFNHRTGEDTFSLQTSSGPIRGTVGEEDLDGRGVATTDDTLGNAPLSVNGEIYVPVGFLTRIADLRANWNRRDLRLDLDTYRDPLTR